MGSGGQNTDTALPEVRTQVRSRYRDLRCVCGDVEM